MGHDPGYEQILPLPDAQAESTTLADMLSIVRRHLGPDACLDLDFELVTDFYCPACATRQPVFRPLRELDHAAAQCPQCGQPRQPITVHTLYGGESYLGRTLASIGVPPLHILGARNSTAMLYFELTGDEAGFFHWA